MKFRYTILVIIFALVYGGLVFKLYDLQLEKGAEYFQRVEAREKISQNNFSRGTINFVDRYQNLIPVANIKKFPIIYAVPKEISQPEKTAEALAPIIGWSKEKLIALISMPGELFKLLVAKASDSQIKSVQSLNLKGVYVVYQNFRYYPYANLASQLIGFVGVNEKNDQPVGLYGMESFYNEKLQNNQDLTLTIDRSLQAQAEQILENLIKKFEAVAGTAIIEEPATGKILALTNKPDFDPNNYGQAEVGSFLNPAIKSLYEPGSVLKVITMAAGIDSKKITPDTTYYDNGSVTLNGKTITNWDNKGHGKVTMTNVIEQSINTGAVWAERTIGHDIFYNYLLKFGLNKPTGIDFSQEQSGNLSNLKRKQAQDIEFATASYGQGIAVTPLELVNAFSAIANGGNLMRPYFNAELKPKVIRRVISEDTAREVTDMMVSGVEKAEVAAISNYRVAGKTGTAYVPDFKKGGYTDEVINTYIGFAPADNPQFVILLRIDKPKGAPLSGLSVVPAFKELAQFVLNYYNIPPDKLAISQ
jgi:cell division protein FtsI/penicillin-binding protein 2